MRKVKSVFAAVFLGTFCMLFNLVVQAQTAPAAGDSTAAGSIGSTIFGITIPAWAQTVFFAFITILPAIQLVLKRIPTNGSVKIGGVLGKILDVLTFFQKDITGGSK